jgi:hypothetical protein
MHRHLHSAARLCLHEVARPSSLQSQFFGNCALLFVYGCVRTGATGRYCGLGMTTAFGEACEVGQYSQSANMPNCTPCATGTYAPVTGMTNCRLCDPGKYAARTGATECAFCPALTYGDRPGLSSPRCSGTCRALPGRRCPKGAHAENGIDCPRGRYSTGGNATDCINCPSGR